eukprot:6175361-Pleurochrysis_carterae.AAC.3
MIGNDGVICTDGISRTGGKVRNRETSARGPQTCPTKSVQGHSWTGLRLHRVRAGSQKGGQGVDGSPNGQVLHFEARAQTVRLLRKAKSQTNPLRRAPVLVTTSESRHSVCPALCADVNAPIFLLGSSALKRGGTVDSDALGGGGGNLPRKQRVHRPQLVTGARDGRPSCGVN